MMLNNKKSKYNCIGYTNIFSMVVFIGQAIQWLINYYESEKTRRVCEM